MFITGYRLSEDKLQISRTVTGTGSSPTLEQDSSSWTNTYWAPTIDLSQYSAVIMLQERRYFLISWCVCSLVENHVMEQVCAPEGLGATGGKHRRYRGHNRERPAYLRCSGKAFFPRKVTSEPETMCRYVPRRPGGKGHCRPSEPQTRCGGVSPSFHMTPGWKCFFLTIMKLSAFSHCGTLISNLFHFHA